jgi:hypothetical protein
MPLVVIRLLSGLIGAALVGRGIEAALSSSRVKGVLARAGFEDLTRQSGLELASKYGRAAFAVLFGAWAVLEEADEESDSIAAASPWPNRIQRAAALMFVLASLVETVSAFVNERHMRLLAGRPGA